MSPHRSKQPSKVMILQPILLPPFLNNLPHLRKVRVRIACKQMVLLMHIQSSRQVQEKRIITAEISAILIGLNSPVVLHKVIISRVLVQDVPVIHVDKPHEPMTDSKDHCHEYWETPEESVEVALDAEAEEAELRHHE